MTTEQLHEQEIKALQKTLKDLDIKTRDDARTFITALTKLIYDYKMLGIIYEYYADNVEYYKQDDTIIDGVGDVVLNVADLCAAFPNLRTNIESLIVYPVDENFYKIGRRLHYWGNNYGHSRFGPPTGKSLANNCQNMSIIHLKKLGGRWKITFEINSDSQDWLREVMTPDAALVNETACSTPPEADTAVLEEAFSLAIEE